MLTRFISDSAWGAPDYIYPYDNTVNIKATKLNVAGNINATYAPFLENLSDFTNNNYSLFFLTEKKSLSSIVEIKEPALYNIESKYPCLLGVFVEGDLIKETSLFLECIPLYKHANEFEVRFFSANTATSISGGSLQFYITDPTPSEAEIGFSVNGSDPVFVSDTDAKYIIDVSNETSMRSLADSLSTTINTLDICNFLSGNDISETSDNQTFTLIISTYDGSPLSGETMGGYSFVIPNTQLGYIPELSEGLKYKKFAFSFKVQGVDAFLPPGYNDEFFVIPRFSQFLKSDNSETVTRTLTSLFDPAQIGTNNYYPSSKYFGLESYSFTQSSIQLNIFNRLSGSTVEAPYTFNPLNNEDNDFRIDVTKKGIDAGFRLFFGRKGVDTETNFKLPERYSANNTTFNLSSISTLELSQDNNFIIYSFKPNFVDLFANKDRVFLDFNIIDEKQVYITHTLYQRIAYLVSDDIEKRLFFIDSSNIDNTNIEIAKFNYILDNSNKKLILYRVINEQIYALSVDGTNLVYNLITDLDNIEEESVLSLFSFNDIKVLFEKNEWISYTREFNSNNLNILPERSYDIKNNFLIHSEYSNSNSNLHINFFPLKNQLNEINNQGRLKDNIDFRGYHSLYTGDNNEKGTTSISVGYIANTKEYIFKSGNITWFHLPYNENFKRIGINETNFRENGAIPGSSPVFSDKIWKKIGSYKYTSNLGDSKIEQTGQWLCAWLSGGSNGEDAIWVDRFYNPDILTEIEAIKITNNNEYIPSYTAKNYAKGITDRPSTLSLEPGVWYAYNHIGKNDALPVIEYIKKDIIQEGLINFNITNENEYRFTGKQTGYISIQDYQTPLNIFTLAFYGHSDNWNQKLGNQLIGCYLDSGFGIFNFLEINPVTYYFEKNKLFGYNIENAQVFSLTLPSNVDGDIVGLFRRNYYENFHIVTDTFNILEYNIDGTLVDLVSTVEIGFSEVKTVLGVANNLNKGVILYSDFSYSIVDLRTNVVTNFADLSEAVTVNFESIGGEYTVFIDNTDSVFVIKGRQPILRENYLYFIDYNEKRKIYVFDRVDKTKNLYIDTSVLESIPLSPFVTLNYANEDQIIQDDPNYTNFNLTSLSGIGLTLYPSNGQEYSLGLSIYRDSYIINGNRVRDVLNVPSNTILVDLNGNYWYKADETSNEKIGELLNSDRLGWSVNINTEGTVLIGDPEYTEELATTQVYGKVFAYNSKNQKLQPIGSLDVGPRPQIYDLVFTSSSNPVSSFPLSSSIIFTNGSDIYNSIYGDNSNITNRPYVSAISLAFSVNDSQPVHSSDIFNKVNYTFANPVTSINALINELTTVFNLDIIPQSTGFVALSTFFTFSLIENSSDGFTIRVRNIYEGATSGPVVFEGADDLLALNYFYSAIQIRDGLEATGINGQNFGWQVKSINYKDVNIDSFASSVFVSSPGWPGGGKVTVYQDVTFDTVNNETTFLTAIDIVNPTSNIGSEFGYSIDIKDWSYDDEEDYIGVGLLVGAPGASVLASTSAYYYDMVTTSNQYGPHYTLVGSTSSRWGHKVGLGKYFMAISAPLSSRVYNGLQEGGVEIFGFLPSDKSGEPQYKAHLSPNDQGQRYRFGWSFDIEDNLMAVASISGVEGGLGGITVDLYKRDSFNPEIYTEFKLLSTLTSPFLNFESNISTLLSTMEVDVKFNKNYLAVGAWRGDEEDFGDEHNKVVVWEINKDTCYQVFDYFDRNTDKTTFKTYVGKSVSMSLDKLITGTYFIYNTGNSLYYAASAINTAVAAQTNNTFSGKINYVDNNNVNLTITTLISATDLEFPKLYTTVPSLTTLNVIKITDYFPGSPLYYSGDIISFTFDQEEETKVFTDYNRIKTYDVLGDFKSTLLLNEYGMPQNLSGIRYGLSNVYLNGEIIENSSILGVDDLNRIYKINFVEKTKNLSYEIIDSNEEGNAFFYPLSATFEQITRQTFDITNCVFTGGIIRAQNNPPSLTFKLRLNNRLDYEDALVLEPLYPVENLNKGWHHFAIIFDSVNGKYIGYVDAKQIFNYDFDPGKYTYSTILKNNILVGTAPFYNNVPYNNFYKSSNPYFNITGLTLDNIKFYNRALHQEEIKFLQYEKVEPKDLRVQIDYGDRNYIDTISRLSKHKVPGRKSQFIDVYITDSLIDDIDLQKYYETKIISELKEYLPAYVKINKIVWKTNKISREKIIQGDINIGNTLTNSGGIE